VAIPIPALLRTNRCLGRLLPWCFPSWHVDVAVLAAHLAAHAVGLPLSGHVVVAVAAHALATAVLVDHRAAGR
jgi:hypothetical protein